MQMALRIAFRVQGPKESIIRNFCCFLLDSSVALFLRLRVMVFLKGSGRTMKEDIFLLLIFD